MSSGMILLSGLIKSMQLIQSSEMSLSLSLILSDEAI